MAIRALRPCLGEAIGATRKIVGLQRDTMKKAEGALLEQGLEVPIWSKVGSTMFEAVRAANLWRAGMNSRIAKVTSTFKGGESENILMAIIDEASAVKFHGTTAEQFKKARELEAVMVDALMEGGGLSKPQALRFLKEDLVQLRKAQGDISRMSPNNIYPKTFQPWFDDIAAGHISPTRTDAHGLAWDIVNMGERARFLKPAAAEAFAEVRGWNKLGMHGDDLLDATKLANDFIKANLQQHQTGAGIIASGLSKVTSKISELMGGQGIQISDADINKWAMHMSGWYGGVAMAARPALAMRNMTQILLPAVKVGYGHLGRALGEVYGKDREMIVNRAYKHLGVTPESVDVYLGQSAAGRPGTRKGLGRVVQGARDLQKLALVPYRWSDVTHNRVVTFQMGHRAVEAEAPALLRGDITWDTFMLRTGLTGSPKVDQIRIKSLLQGKEHPNIAQAAIEYGKTLVEDTQFIYDSVNSPAAFQGTLGRIFGQFGVWPVGFTEFIMQNAGTRNAAYFKKFVGNYAIQKTALAGVGLAVGVDTSTWNFANPLSFQGGPWYQAMRDVATLGTSSNEFEQREARNNLRRMVGRGGTPFTGILNPIGGATTDWIQAAAADNPVDAMLLALGFNLQSNKPAISRGK